MQLRIENPSVYFCGKVPHVVGGDFLDRWSFRAPDQ